MANNRLVIDLLPEFLAALKQLPAELLAEADTIIDDRAELAISEIRQAYPIRTGNLRRGLSISVSKKGFFTQRTIRNRAPHAQIFEHGTQARHTKLGANRGAMPPGRVFIPTMIRHRKMLEAELVALLIRHGFLVTVDAA